MKTVLKRATVVIGALAIVGSLAACGHHSYRQDPEKHAQRVAEQISKELKLNDQQLGKLNVLKGELLAVARDMREQHPALRTKALSLMDAPKLDRDQLTAMVHERTAALDQAGPKVVSAFGDFFDSLTPGQQNQLRERFAKKSEHHGWFGH